ncbi:MAG: CbiX/SirB N-terminal domain-containing protein [Actinomycetota bacterium]
MTRLLLAAHGTRSTTGLATLAALADSVQARRPELTVELCFVDVAEPSLAVALGSGDAVVVPALLSTGFHVTQDIPAVVAGRRDVQVARHLGPHALLTRALIDRLREAGGAEADAVALVGSGSSRSAAREEIAAAASDLAGALGRAVIALTMSDDLPATFATLRERGSVAVAGYLLAEGFFADALRAAAEDAGVDAVAPVIGAHPAVIDLVLERFDDVVG